jgi:hypothetical protein
MHRQVLGLVIVTFRSLLLNFSGFLFIIEIESQFTLALSVTRWFSGEKQLLSAIHSTSFHHPQQ